MRYIEQLTKWGNGVGILIPGLFLKQLKLFPGDQMDISMENGTITIKPVRKRKPVAERFAEYDGSFRQTEYWNLEPVGKELD